MAASGAARSPSLRPFTIIWVGQACSLLGSSLVQCALIWYLTQTTGSATVLALAAAAGLLPQILLGPFAGALVDRWPRRRVLIASDGLIALATAVLVALFLLRLVTPWHIYLLLFIRATGTAFQWPAMQASTTLLVPVRHLARVGGMNQGLQGLASIVTPPLGALLLGLLPMPAILAIDIATALPAILPLLFIPIPQPQPLPAGGPQAGVVARSAVLSDIAAGAAYLWRWPGMLLLSSMGILIRLLVWPGATLLPIMVTRHLGGGALQLAWLETAGGGGMLAGGIVLGAWGGFRRRIVTAMLALLLDGVAITVIGLVPRDGLLVAIGAFFASGFLETFVFGATGAVFQATVPPALQGRLLGLLNAAGMAMVPVGLAIAGPAADRFGPQLWFLIGGVTTAAMAAAAFFVPSIMRIEEGAPDTRPARPLAAH